MLQHPSGAWTFGRYVVVHPAANTDMADLCDRSSDLLADDATFRAITLESVIHSDALPRPIAAALAARYVID